MQLNLTRNRFDVLFLMLIVPTYLNAFQLVGMSTIIQFFNLSLGTPHQFFKFHTEFTIPDVLVIDDHCGKILEKCPKYCKESKFLDAYCPPSCLQLRSAVHKLYCPDDSDYKPRRLDTGNKLVPPTPSQFHSNLSDTFEASNKTWKTHIFNTRFLYGEYATDTIGLWFPLLSQFLNKTKPVIEVSNITFVRGTWLDSRFLADHQAIIGLAPSTQSVLNLVDQFYKQNLIPERLISMSSLLIEKNKHPMPMISFGQLDNINCGAYSWRKSLSEDKWLLEFDSIEIVGQKFKENNRIAFETTILDVAMPRKFAKQLVDSGVFIQYGNKFLFNKTTTPLLNFKIQVGNTEARIPDKVLSGGSTRHDGLLVSVFSINDQEKFSDSPTWIFGITYARYFCLGLNYSNMEFGLASLNDNIYK